MTQIVGILNITPDSFSGDGIHQRSIADRIVTLIAQGADVIDIGAESTRPNAVILSAQEEWQRFEPVMAEIVAYASKVAFSLDTYHAETALRFIKAFPASCYNRIFINDVSGGKDKQLVETALHYGTQLVLMHSLTVPADKHITLPEGADAMQIVTTWGKEKIKQFGASIILDPGIGFGKTAVQSLHIIKHIRQFKSLGAPVMVGHSRKSFLSLFSNSPSVERDSETLIISGYLVAHEVDYLRVHDVRNHVIMRKIQEYLFA